MFDEIKIILSNFVTDGINDILAGILVPVFLWLLVKIYQSILSLTSYKKYKKILGKYNFYHWAPSGRDEICEGEIQIKSFFGFLYVKALSYEYNYKGKIEIDKNIYISLSATNFDEKWSFIFPEPPPVNKVKKLWGVSSGVSPFYEPVAYKVLLSVECLSQELLKQEFKENIHDGNHFLIRTPINNSVRDDNI